MSVFLLSRSLEFPDPVMAEPDGLLAVGGDLSIPRLLVAYSMGIFPWYSKGSPILWWAPSPRPILEPERLHVPSSLRRSMNKGRFEITLDRDFASVIRACAKADRPEGCGTWLVPDMIRAYIALHEAGYAHSVEAWLGGQLAGGLYGVALGRVFFGESMFYRAPDASKTAFVTLARHLRERGYNFIDCQQTTRHLLRFGAFEVGRREFLGRLQDALAHPTERGTWKLAGPDCLPAPDEAGQGS